MSYICLYIKVTVRIVLDLSKTIYDVDVMNKCVTSTSHQYGCFSMDIIFNIFNNILLLLIIIIIIIIICDLNILTNI